MNTMTETRTAAASSYPTHGMPVALVAPRSVPSSATGLLNAGVVAMGRVAFDQRTRIAPKGAPPRGEPR